MEMKLILSSNAKGWNFSENFITEKAMNEPEPWEFGYAAGASRPLVASGRGRRSARCAWSIGKARRGEMYGGLGTTDGFGLKADVALCGAGGEIGHSSAALGPFRAGFWELNDNSLGVLWRVGVNYEFQQFFSRLKRGGRDEHGGGWACAGVALVAWRR